jgi:uncharacterized integral membrane protein
MKKNKLKSIALIALSAISGITFFQNIEPVPVHFLFWTFPISKLLMNMIFLVIGLIGGLLLRPCLTPKVEADSK